ncbi:rCG46229 [Rattus norvegicus]|uniref:RCG46229 n=1 Tax=Rattus norvegicus TaxID=10116 RepID=A6ID66_RAT|nr:rCG46229 [Rattus norvegicus]
MYLLLHILEKIKAFSLNFVLFVCMLFILKMAHFVKMLFPFLPWKLTQPLVAPK